MVKLTTPEQLLSYREKLQAVREHDKPCIKICGGTGCRANRGLEVANVFRNILKKKQLDQKVDIRITGCHGFCEQGPLVVLLPQGILYVSVTPEDVEQIDQGTFVGVIEAISHLIGLYYEHIISQVFQSIDEEKFQSEVDTMYEEMSAEMSILAEPPE